MNIEEIKALIENIPSQCLRLGDSEFDFATLQNFDEFQISYRKDDKGNSLISDLKDGWQDSWYVIGTDDLGDPIFIDLQDSLIYTAMENKGKWDAIPIADSLERLVTILTRLKDLSKGRETPENLKKRPITTTELNDFSKLFRDAPEAVDVEYWISVISN